MNFTQNERIEQVSNETLVIGIDIGSQTHYARVLITEGENLGSKYVSRQHASIKFDDGKWYIRDDFSLNGTWLNSTQLEPGVWYSLVINDSIDIAHQTVLVFMKLSKYGLINYSRRTSA